MCHTLPGRVPHTARSHGAAGVRGGRCSVAAARVQFFKIAVTKFDSKRHVLIVDHHNPISAGTRPPKPPAAGAREAVIDVLAGAVFALILDRTRSDAHVEPQLAGANTTARKERQT